ncbi:pyridoxal phosphate-dependent aminotransferase [Lentzea sp. BCCO 10_0856]|uniref:Pyridoxal phosphate-dependent aminotransferase n=1 Tax=Lentzea miocenica TaxID=3095431 RepID=A0ABU4T6P3_9PSEU|nr:pyridoxal phosphate-dependent aminotransferase [Lentzea sp. BCCO 10_0856]MDX8033823.1 pyridoxal phosphate-dependent aminotransferase [Lentzea sp. BCCO 10_0856]
MLDLTGGQLPWPDDLRALWTDCLARACHGAMDRTPPWRGVAGLSEVLGELLEVPDHVYVTSGVRALIPAFTLLGRKVIVERPTYDGVPAAFRRCGADVELGDLTDALDADPARHLVWLTSPGRNPDGWTLTEELAGEFGAWVARGGVVVQNETYRWFAGDGPRVPGAHLIGSFNKLAGGWSRTGWLAGSADGPLGAYLRTGTPPTPWQAAWAAFADRGLPLLLERARKTGEITKRVAALTGTSARGASVLVPVSAEWLRERGVAAGPGPAFHAPEHTARLSFLGCDDCDHDAVLRAALEN